MSDIPIIFSGPMVRALLEGRKTMTRRLALRKCPGRIGEPCARCNDTGFVASPWQKIAPGDRLYVRENFAYVGTTDPGYLLYAADWRECAARLRLENIPDKPPRWTPCIHMPRALSRLTLTVTAVKIERLQDISGDDAILEGIPLADHKCGCERCGQTSQLCPATMSSLCMAFADLWRSLHGAESWDDNPEVVALSFTIEQRNIDSNVASEAVSRMEG